MPSSIRDMKEAQQCAIISYWQAETEDGEKSQRLIPLYVA